jgi:hypothetical protein
MEYCSSKVIDVIVALTLCERNQIKFICLRRLLGGLYFYSIDKDAITTREGSEVEVMSDDDISDVLRVGLKDTPVDVLLSRAEEIKQIVSIPESCINYTTYIIHSIKGGVYEIRAFTLNAKEFACVVEFTPESLVDFDYLCTKPLWKYLVDGSIGFNVKEVVDEPLV